MAPPSSISPLPDDHLHPASFTCAQFAAARALWRLGSDPQRARTLGREALVGAQAHPDHELLSAVEIEQWLQAVGGSSSN